LQTQNILCQSFKKRSPSRRKKSISCDGRLNELGVGLSMFGMRSKVKNPSSIKIMIVDVDEPDAIEELSSYLSELKPSKKLPEGKYL
jgi:hypothetical protein